MKYAFLLFCFLGQHALAAGIVGTFDGRAPSRHYRTIVITQRGPEYFLSTSGAFGNASLPITAGLKETEPGVFNTFSGSITGYYGNLVCTYPISLRLVLSGDQLFISEYGPGRFPPSYGRCPEVADMNFSDYIEPDTYLRNP